MSAVGAVSDMATAAESQISRLASGEGARPSNGVTTRRESLPAAFLGSDLRTAKASPFSVESEGIVLLRAAVLMGIVLYLYKERRFRKGLATPLSRGTFVPGLRSCFPHLPPTKCRSARWHSIGVESGLNHNALWNTSSFGILCSPARQDNGSNHLEFRV